jgi:hypothetical protein
MITFLSFDDLSEHQTDVYRTESACAASSMRIYYIVLLGQQGDRPDNTYYIAWMGVWSYAELALGIMISCFLTLPKLFQAHGIHLSSFFSSLTKPFSSFKFSWRDPSNMSDGSRKKSASQDFKLTFNQKADFGPTFRESSVGFETGGYLLTEQPSREETRKPSIALSSES